MTEASIKVDNSILVKTFADQQFQEFHGPLFSSKNGNIQAYSLRTLTTIPIKAIFSMHTQISSRYIIGTLILSMNVTGGHYKPLVN